MQSVEDVDLWLQRWSTALRIRPVRQDRQAQAVGAKCIAHQSYDSSVDGRGEWMQPYASIPPRVDQLFLCGDSLAFSVAKCIVLLLSGLPPVPKQPSGSGCLHDRLARLADLPTCTTIGEQVFQHQIARADRLLVERAQRDDAAR